MLFVMTYRWRNNATDEDTRRVRNLFVAWSPPAGMELLGHYYFARGGGVAIVDVAAPAVLFEALTPFNRSIEFDIEPVLNVMDAVAISMDVDEWAQSVSNAGQHESSNGR